MEFVKIDSSGTLWYLKKWIVFYYYVFLKEELFDQDYERISEIFLNFINSLPSNIRAKAHEYFFSVDLTSTSFLKLWSFINLDSQSFSHPEDKRDYIIKGKRFYFMYLMDSGGQAGWKEKIKNKILAWKNYPVLISEITAEMTREGMSRDDIVGQLNDFPASIRNERQIFFYYWLFHGKYSADLSGFYNLTNVWKAIVESNFHELLLIWEHQKLIMISQSPIADIQRLENWLWGWSGENFDILNHPYCELLNIITAKNGISIEEYQYVISKFTNTNHVNIDNITTELIVLAKAKVESFHRAGDTARDDFLKELKKFALWICKLPKDEDTNYFSFISWPKDNKVKLLEREKWAFIVNNYNIISSYLDLKHKDTYEIFSSQLREKYISLVNNSNFNIDDETTYEWYKYIINFDKNIFISLIYLAISVREGKYALDISGECISTYYENYEYMLKSFWIKKSNFKLLMQDVQASLRGNTIFQTDIENNDWLLAVSPVDFETSVTEDKLKDLSKSTDSPTILINLGRKRNFSLVNALKAFYFKNYLNPETNLLHCDCCWENTFLMENSLPYMEFHHLIPFSTDFGPDHYLNLFWICPNCHRKMHYLNSAEKPELYTALSDNNNPNKKLMARIDTLFKEKVIEPIHLDFLKKEKIIDQETYEKYFNNSSAS